jgi:hypothetical protein
MCDVLLPPGVNPTAVKYMYHVIYHIWIYKLNNHEPDDGDKPKHVVLIKSIFLNSFMCLTDHPTPYYHEHNVDASNKSYYNFTFRCF